MEQAHLSLDSQCKPVRVIEGCKKLLPCIVDFAPLCSFFACSKNACIRQHCVCNAPRRHLNFAHVHAQKSMESLDWSRLHSLLKGEVEVAPSMSRNDDNTWNLLTETSSVEIGLYEARTTGRAMPKEAMSKSAQLKAWVAGLRESRNVESLSVPTPGPCQGPAMTGAHHDVESGFLRPRSSQELAHAAVEKILRSHPYELSTAPQIPKARVEPRTSSARKKGARHVDGPDFA
eukprot:1157437-Pelagomonas_calceolata.AAC.17